MFLLKHMKLLLKQHFTQKSLVKTVDPNFKFLIKNSRDQSIWAETSYKGYFQVYTFLNSFDGKSTSGFSIWINMTIQQVVSVLDNEPSTLIDSISDLIRTREKC